MKNRETDYTLVYTVCHGNPTQESLVIVQCGNGKAPSLSSGCISPAYRAAEATAAASLSDVKERPKS